MRVRRSLPIRTMSIWCFIFNLLDEELLSVNGNAVLAINGKAGFAVYILNRCEA